MAIKSSTFGRVVLSGKDAARFSRHMAEDKANPLALSALARGSENKVPFVAAVSINSAGYPNCVKLTPVAGFTRDCLSV